MATFLIILLLVSAGAVAGVMAVLTTTCGVRFAVGAPTAVVWTAFSYWVHPVFGVLVTTAQLYHCHLMYNRAMEARA